MSMNEDKLIGISSEQIAALAEISATASELEGLVSQGMTIAQEALGQLERRGADELSEGITGKIVNHREGMNVDGHAGMQRSINILEQRVGNIRNNPNGGDTLDRSRNSASETESAMSQATERVTEAFEAGREFGRNPTQENARKAACTVLANAAAGATTVVTKSVGAGGTAYGLTKAACDSLAESRWDPRVERRRRREANKNSRPWGSTPLPENAHGEVPEHLQQFSKRDLASERLRRLNPRIDPSELDSTGLVRVIEDVDLIQSMDLFHGGTSTGAFIEGGTLRLDQADLAGFLGSNGGTSTGDEQLI